MIRFVTDENFDNTILRGLLRENPKLDIVRVQDVGLSGTGDSQILEWAADERRIILTHDVTTVTRYAYDRVRAEQPMPGVIEVSPLAPIGRVIDDILLLAECSLDDEWEGQVIYLPF